MGVPETDLSRLKIDWKETSGREPHRWRWPVWMMAAALLLMGAGAAYRLLVRMPLTVETVTVSLTRPSQAGAVLNASGYVVAQRRAAVASKATGRIIELRVREGDRVKKDAVLARLESGDLQAALSRALANLEGARSALEEARAEQTDATLGYERRKELIATRLISKSEFDAAEARHLRAKAAVTTAEAAIRAAEAAVRATEVELENTRIRAPFDGTILTKNAEVGEVVAPFGSSATAKAAVVTMADMDSLQVEADVSESNIEKIRVGQPCEITLDAFPEATYEGVVQAIVPTVDRAKATVLTKIRFTNRDDRILPEMSARVAFLSDAPQGRDERPRLTVHPGAVVRRGDRAVAFRVRGDRAEEVTVTVGGPVGNLVEVTGGLTAGDRVVLNPSAELKGGDRVLIQR
jgi:RND family efflux transporter MFP subunit